MSNALMIIIQNGHVVWQKLIMDVLAAVLKVDFIQGATEELSCMIRSALGKDDSGSSAEDRHIGVRLETGRSVAFV